MPTRATRSIATTTSHTTNPNPGSELRRARRASQSRPSRTAMMREAEREPSLLGGFPLPAQIGIAFGIALLLFLGGLSVVESTGTDDDWGIAIAITGYGTKGLSLFVNALLCQAIRLASDIFPGFNAFFALEFASSYLALGSIAFVAFTRMRRSVGAMLFSAVMFLNLVLLTSNSNFTAAAAIQTCAGCMLLFAGIREGRRIPRRAFVILGILLVAFGFMWRFKMCVIGCLFFGVLALIHIAYRPPSSVRELFRTWSPLFYAALVLAALFAYDALMWSSPEWSEWKAYNEARSAVSDYPMKDYDEVAEELSAAGISEVDYKFAVDWVTADPDVFDKEMLERIYEIGHDDGSTESGFAALSKTGISLPSVLVGIAIMALALARQRRMPPAFIIAAIALGLLAYLIHGGRIPMRVSSPIITFALCSMALIPEPSRQHEGFSWSFEAEGRLRAACAALSFLLCLALLVPFVGNVSFDRLRQGFSNEAVAPGNTVLAYEAEHPDAVFVWRTLEYRCFEEAYGIRCVPTRDMLLRNIPLGGWSVGSPFAQKRNKEAGMESLLLGLAEQDSALLVTADKKLVPDIQEFLAQHYDIETDYEVIDEFRSDSKVKLYVYDFSVVE